MKKVALNYRMISPRLVENVAKSSLDQAIELATKKYVDKYTAVPASTVIRNSQACTTTYGTNVFVTNLHKQKSVVVLWNRTEICSLHQSLIQKESLNTKLLFKTD